MLNADELSNVGLAFDGEYIQNLYEFRPKDWLCDFLRRNQNSALGEIRCSNVKSVNDGNAVLDCFRFPNFEGSVEIPVDASMLEVFSVELHLQSISRITRLEDRFQT